MPIATNPETGAVVFLDEKGGWQPATTSVNPETKEMLAYDGRDWKPVPVSSGVISALKSFLAPTSPPGDMSWLDVAKSAVTNVPSSAANFAHDIVQPIIHPIDTATAIKDIGTGVLQKFGIVDGKDSEKYADAVGKFFADRYGSIDGVKKAIATDPVGVLGDLATVLTLGGGAAARGPGVVGKLGEIVGTVGRAVDPLTAVGKGITTAGKVGAEVIGGLTGTGGKSLRLAAEAGAEGGEAGRAFLDNMNRAVPMGQVVSEAKSAMDVLRAERGVVYRQGMKEIGKDTTVLDFAPIDAAVQKTDVVKNYKGQELSPKTAEIRTEIATEINKWKALDPKEFHTAEGLDALKQKIGDIRDAAEHGSPQRLVAEQIYNSIRATIVAQAPKYAEVMKGYEQASAIVQEIEKALSVNKGASIDTGLRKLQSVLRDNVSANYGNRGAMADFLVNAGAPKLLTKLAGQSLSTWTPRGIGAASAVAGGLGLPALATVNPKAAAIGAATLPFTSPKLMGGLAYGAGVASRFGKPAGEAAFFVGRESRNAAERRK